ncbi:MAG: sulfotransferase [Gammaproteobacteria bacterium]
MNSSVPKHTFIGGFRSGTTLLINLLGLHPEVAPWFETKFVCEALRWQRLQEYPEQAESERQLMQPAHLRGYSLQDVVARMKADMQATAARLEGRLESGKASHERYPIGHDCVRYSLPEAEAALARWRAGIEAAPSSVSNATGALITSLGRRHAESWARPLWINKTPESPRFGAELRSALGDCRIILLIRDGRQVVRSSKKLHWGDVEQMALWWKGLIQQSRIANPEPDRYLEVRYEDLLTEPAYTLDRILAFLRLPAAGASIAAEYRHRLGKNAFKQPLWRRWQTLYGSERRAFDRIAGDLSEELGYH